MFGSPQKDTSDTPPWWTQLAWMVVATMGDSSNEAVSRCVKKTNAATDKRGSSGNNYRHDSVAALAVTGWDSDEEGSGSTSLLAFSFGDTHIKRTVPSANPRPINGIRP